MLLKTDLKYLYKKTNEESNIRYYLNCLL